MVGTEFLYEIQPTDVNDLLVKSLIEPVLSGDESTLSNESSKVGSPESEIERLKIYRSAQTRGYLLRQARVEMAQARQRLVICQIIKKALQRNDDLTVCRWLDENLLQNPDSFSFKENEKIKQIKERLRLVEEFRRSALANQVEKIVEIFQNSDLKDSNLFSVEDQRLYNRALREIENKKQVTEREISNRSFWTSQDVSSRSEDELIKDWLEGNVILDDHMNNMNRQKVEKAILKIGLNTRIERALSRKDKKYLLLLTRSGSLFQKSFLNPELQERLNTFLAE